MKARKWLLGGLPFVLAGLILALGLLLPQQAFHRLRQSYLNGENTISADAVHPYGEVYEETKTALLSNLRLFYAMNQSDEVQEIPLSEATDQQQADYAAGLAQVREFLGILQSQLVEVDFTGFLDAMEQGEKLLYSLDGEEPAIASIEPDDEAQGLLNLLGFSLDSGTPLVLTLTLPVSQEVDIDRVWEALLETYQQFTGIPFIQRSVDQDTYSYGGDLLAYQRMEAVSAGSAFSLTAELYDRALYDSGGIYLTMDVALTENGVEW
jgi:hypothetical protein